MEEASAFDLFFGVGGSGDINQGRIEIDVGGDI